MPLLTPEPAPTAARAVETTFRAFADSGTFRSVALRSATELQLTAPHQVFTLGLDDLIAGRGLAAAKPTGWRYLVNDGDKAVASAESVAAGAGEDHVFSHFNEGPFVASTEAAIKTAAALPQASSGGHEVRLLHVPGLYVMALWLHDTQGSDDLLVPLAPSPVDAPAGQPVPAAQLLAELAAKAAPAAAVGPADQSGG